jgi:MFS family permease
MAAWARRILPEQSGGRLFVLLTFVDAIGTGMFMAGAVVFFVRSIGLTNNEVGTGLTIAGLVGLVTSVPMGALGDHIGAKRMLVIMQYWRAACFLALTICTNLVLFVVIASAASMSESVTGALTQAVVPEVVGEDQRVRTMALIRSVRNIGFALGALLAAPLTAAGSRPALQVIVVLNALSFVVAGILLARVKVAAHRTTRLSAGAGGPIRALRGFRDWRYVALTALNVVFSLHLTLLVIVIPLWIITATTAPPLIISVLLLVNTVMAVLLQMPLSRPAETVPGSKRLMTLAGLALAACSLIMIAASLVPAWAAVALLVLGMVFMSLGEIWQSAAAWTLSYTFAPAAQRVQYLTIFGISGLLAQDVFGPFLLGGIMIDVGRLGWLALAALFLISIVALGPVISRLRQRQEERTVFSAGQALSSKT